VKKLKRQIGRPVAGPNAKHALEAFGGLHRTREEGTADALAKAVNSTRKGKAATLDALKNPWAA